MDAMSRTVLASAQLPLCRERSRNVPAFVVRLFPTKSVPEFCQRNMVVLRTARLGAVHRQVPGQAPFSQFVQWPGNTQPERMWEPYLGDASAVSQGGRNG